ncbi:MAG: terpene cyclase/mutase family protein [Planctomycetota bacterium]|nr:terpene cyclase/mutase family protein [Planctomycetota bacterium]MDI6788787.1 terpene cyclase/mutase family protein [Planctomycetota bacterium]
MLKMNILLAGILVIIAGVIVVLSFVIKPMLPDVKVRQKQPLPTSKPSPSEIKPALEESFDKGMHWLMQKQLPSGAFPDLQNKDDVAFTSMGLIIITSSPNQTPTRQAPTRQAKYAQETTKALRYILSCSQENGNIIDPGKVPSFDIYKTSLSIVALKTILPSRPVEEQHQIKEVIDKAVKYLQESQYGPESADIDRGGWGYKEKEGEKIPNTNLSTTSYVLEALHKSGLPKESETYQRSIDFLMKCQDSSEYNTYRVTANSGGFAYSPVESKAGEEITADGKKVLKPYGSMTYAGLLSFIYAYVDKNDPRVLSSYNWIRARYTLEENPGLRSDAQPDIGKQGLFYYYHTFAKALDTYGEKKITTLDGKEHLWANDLVVKLVSLQSADGHWQNENPRWWEDSPLLATSYSLMALNICRKWVE